MTDPVSWSMFDPSAAASNPARLEVDEDRLRQLRPDLFGVRGLWHRALPGVLSILSGTELPNRPHGRFIRGQLWHGDARAAVVVNTSPLFVAAYSDESDCVAMLRCPDELAERYDLGVGSRLLTVNSYRSSLNGQNDLEPGPHQSGRYNGFHPIIADFITTNDARLAELRNKIAEEEWQRTRELGETHLATRPHVYRNGRPAKSEWSTSARREAIVAAVVIVAVVIAAIAIGLEFM